MTRANRRPSQTARCIPNPSAVGAQHPTTYRDASCPQGPGVYTDAELHVALLENHPELCDHTILVRKKVEAIYKEASSA